MSRSLSPVVTALAAFLTLRGMATPVINELMFHTAAVPENHAQEWIEIYNDSATSTFDLTGWRFSKGVTFTFPNGTSLAPGAYLVIAADVPTFQAGHPGFAGQLTGGWTGTLGNSGDTLRLVDAAGTQIDEVTYAKDGDWAVRARGPVDFGHQGWVWTNAADGGGSSLELRNKTFAGFSNGQAWGASSVAGGTPGAANSIASADIAPLIDHVKARPEIARSTDPIVVSAEFTDDNAATITAILHWRVDAGVWQTATMIDTDGDGAREATIPAQANNTILEYYIEAGDGVNTRTWPAPAAVAGQVVNALIQVDNTYNPNLAWTPGAQPIYRIILTAAERAELQQIWTNAAQDASNASFNATFISQDGEGLNTKYLCDVRNRGNSSRLGPPNNALVSFRSDDHWNGRASLDINCRQPHSQVLGALLMTRMGINTQDIVPVKARFNGVDIADTGAIGYDTYARQEPLDGDWAKNHFPLDPSGNLYQVRYSPTEEGNLRYEGTDPNSYRDTYFKQTNVDADDWTDLIHLCDVLNNAPAAGYKNSISAVINYDQWLTFFAANSLIGNEEGGISTGKGDDYSLYRGIADTRFQLAEHDLDTIFVWGGADGNANRSIVAYYEIFPGLNRMFNDPDFLRDYYAKFVALTNTSFIPAVMNPLIDQAIGYTPAAEVTAAKNYVAARRAGVLAQIQQNYSFTVTGNATDVNGMKQTTDGSSTFSGTFNVAQARSILLNGTPATLYYRVNGANAAGSWTLAVAAGSGFLKTGINHVTASFYDGVNGTGNLLKTLTANVYYSGGTQTVIAANGLPGGVGSPTNIVWAAANSPFHITTDVTIATGSTLTIEPGVTVYADENKHVLVNGHVHVVGDPNHHITLSGVPGLPLKADPADPGLPLTTPKWGGFWIENSNDPNNIISYVDFVDAQDTLAASIAVNRGCIEVKESACTIDHCTFRGTHLHMIYGDHVSLTCQYCEFPDEFPGTDVPGALNNVAEPFKLVNKFLPGGHCLVRWNTFHGNKGHNDVLDVDSDVIPNPILQIRENLFLGQSGDEDCDLGGDVFIDGNVFEHGHKDTPNNSAGHASAFSTGDAGTGTTVVCSRNIFWDVDHATTLKTGTATIFEHNTNYALHANFVDVNNNIDVAGAISFVVPAEGTPPGDGAYCGENVFWTIPSVFGAADIGTGGVGTFPTRLQFDLNIVDPATPTAVGSLHPGGLYSLGTGNLITDPKLVNPANGNFALAADSPARGAGFFGNDLGAFVPTGAWITGEPPAQTPSTSATLTVGGSGIFYYKWKLDGGAWSAPIAIDPANPLKFPRTGPTHRTAQLALSGLANGPHTVYVAGQDFGGQWQDDAAATVSKTWTVNTALQLVQINEVLADSATLPDTIELYNGGANTVNIGGWSLSDDPLAPNKYVIPANTMLPAGGYFTVTATTSLINLDKDGDSVYLYNGATLVDSVTFGHQIADLSIGRTGQDGSWSLCQPTLGAANVPQHLGIPGSVRINEWFTSGDVLYQSDWIELANTSALPVALGGLKLTDNAIGNPNASVLPPLSFIGANGFVKLIADSNPASGANHLGFSLDAQQERIALLDPNGALLDIVYFTPQTTDYSQGRDASGNYVYYELPTAGFANGTSDPAYANALALLHGLRITELMFNAIGGDTFDFIELRNTGVTTLQLAGVRFVQGIDFTFPTMALASGQNVIVCKDVTAFRARYGSGPNVAGSYTGKLDNGGETIGLQLPPPFDANVLTFAYSDTWYAGIDGAGKSLVIFDPLAKSNTWGDRASWRASVENGGNPDGFTARSDTYSGWSALHGVLSVTADDDKDGIPALAEYALGMNPANTNGGDGAAGAPFATVNASGHAELHLLVPATAAPQGHGMAEAVYNVQASSDLTTWTTIATKTFATNWTGTVSVGAAGGGFVPVVVEDVNASPQRSLRLQVVWAP